MRRLAAASRGLTFSLVRYQRFLLFAVAAAAVLAPRVLRAQSNPAADSVFERARQLVANGNGAAGRVLVDSMVTVATPNTPAYAEALYWRARLAATGSDAEADYRRLVVEYPLSPRSGDALLQLALLEVARGDRASAIVHLERFLLENPRHEDRARAGLQLVRLSFDQGDAFRGCVTLGRTLREVPESSVELRNQLTYYSPRCANVDTTRRVASADSTATKGDTTKTEGAARGEGRRGAKTTPARPAATQGRFTVQVGAYGTRAEADRNANRLKTRGVDARVVEAEGRFKFRVRVGRYATRAEATAAANKLKAQKIEAFVTEVGAER